MLRRFTKREDLAEQIHLVWNDLPRVERTTSLNETLRHGLEYLRVA
jgi:hypothetical protein